MSLSKLKYEIDQNNFKLTKIEKYIDKLENKDYKGYFIFSELHNSYCILSKLLLENHNIYNIEYINLNKILLNHN